MMPRIARASGLIALLCIIVIPVIIYANSLENPFIWDDIHFIRDNLYIKNWSFFPKLFTENLGAGSGGRYDFYRPLQMVFHMADYSVWKLDVRGFHATNIALHIIATWCLCWLVTVIFHDRSLAWLSGILFAVHPVHTEVVTYISGRVDSLVAIWVLASLTLYIRSYQESGPGLFAGSLLCYALALLTKESAAVLPLLALLYHYAFQKNFGKTRLAAFWLITALYVAFRFSGMAPARISTHECASVFSRIPGCFVAVASYLRMLFLPVGLHMDYGQRVFSAAEPNALLGMAAAVALLSVAFGKRRNDPVYFFAVAWFFINLLPVSNLYPLAFFMAEHYLYVPSMGFFVVIAYTALKLYRSRRYRVPAVIFIAAAVVWCSALTIRQNRVWAEPIGFYQNTLRYTPGSSNALNNLAIMYGEKGDYTAAEALLRRAIEVSPANMNAYVNLAKTLSLTGKKEEAIAYYTKAIAIDPSRTLPHYNLGELYMSIGRYADAAAAFTNAIRLNSDFVLAHYGIGRAYMNLGRHNDAIASFDSATRLDPSFGNAYLGSAVSYFAIHRYQDAVSYYEKAKVRGAVHSELDRALTPYRK